MRRITGSVLILAAFSGCNPQQVAQGDRPPVFQNRQQVAASSWPRNDVPSYPVDSGPDMSKMSNRFVGVAAGPQSPTDLPPAAPTQTAARPAFAPAPTPVPGPADGLTPPTMMVAEGPTGTAPVTPAGAFAPSSIDPALRGAPIVGDRELFDKAPPETAPARMPEFVTGAQAVPAQLPQIVVEPKQAPVAVSLDSKSSPSGSPALRLVNTKRFTLTYAVQDNATGGLTIDLWETRDGKTWKKCDNVQQQPGACQIEVRDEGVFGYTMVARPQSDRGSTQPKPGDVPQVWVTVDATRPVVSLTGVELNLASKAPNLIVRWTAKDRNFGPRPITLSCAERPEGPWVPLATNVENSGRYECAIPANLPKRALLRVEAVDLVGNTGSAQTDRVVRLDFASASSAVNLLPVPPQNQTAEVQRPVVIIYGVEPTSTAKVTPASE
jgi:hypothetical protein